MNPEVTVGPTLAPLEQGTSQPELIAAVNDLRDRVAALEAAMADHQAGARARQVEIDQLRAENTKLRFSQRTGRQV